MDRDVPRALVVDPDAGSRDRAADALDIFGYDVVLCPGPREGSPCIGIRNGHCPLAAEAHVIVLGLPGTSDPGSPGASVLGHYLRDGHPVIVLAGDADAVHSCAHPQVVPVRKEGGAVELISAIGRITARDAPFDPIHGDR